MAASPNISREPRRDVAPTIVDAAPTLVDIDSTAPVLSGADLPFQGDGDRTFTLHTADVIGAGGQGTVVAATDEEGRTFVAKIAYQPHAVRDRLARRAVLGYLRRLMAEHPLGEEHFRETHLMPLYATGQISDEVPGLGESTYDVVVMPLCDDAFTRDGASFEELRDRIIPQAASALAHLHDEGIVHRDVKPKNLYLLEGEVVLGDFGISSVLEEGRDTGATKVDRRTPGYSPHSSVVQRENDWYALGYTIWTLYNGGRHPHQTLIDGDDLSAVLAGGRPVAFEARAPEHETLGQLIYGLTYAHPQGRLGYEDIQRWLADPDAFRYRDPLDAAAMAGPAGYQFEGKVYESRATLVTALANNWEKAKRHLYTHGLEDYFRKLGETDLAVALNDITDRDPDTLPEDENGDEDLGLSRALTLIDPARGAVFWKGEAVVPGASAVDALFARASATPLGFYRLIADEEAVRDLLGIVAVAGFSGPARAGLKWLREHEDANLGEKVDRALAVLEATAADKSAVRSFAARYGSDGWAAWVQRNLKAYHGRTGAGDRLIRAVGSATVNTSAPLADTVEARARLVQRADDMAAHTEGSPHIHHFGIIRESETVVPATAAGYFTAELFGRPVPRGFATELMEASAADKAAVAWARKHLRGARGDALAEDATAALEEAASQIDALADAEGKHAPVDGLSKPAFFGRLVLAVAFVLLVCFVTPRFTFGSWKNGVVNAGEPLATAATVLISPTGMGENSVYPDALWDISSVPTATFTGAALLGFLAAAATVLAPKFASAAFAIRGVRTRGQTRRRATALRKEAARIAEGGGEAACWITGNEEGPVPVARDTSAFIAKTRARRHPEATATALSKGLFWGGALIAAAGVTIVTASGLGYNAWADLASETGWDFLQDQLIWGIAYCGLAALSFAVIAVARREHPTMVTLTLLTIACVIPFLVLFAGTIGIFIVVLYFIFSLFRR